MPDVSLDLTAIANNLPADATPVRNAFTAVQNALNGLDGDNLTDATAEKIGLSSGSGVRRGKSIIGGAESRTNVAYGLMPTPDRVQNVVLPADGLIMVGYQATWQSSLSTARAAIFVGANQLQIATDAGSAMTSAAQLSATGGIDRPLTSAPFGLFTTESATAYGGDVTTGQVVGAQVLQSTDQVWFERGGAPYPLPWNNGLAGGICTIFAAAGTYDISVQFKSGSGSVTVKNRKLWVWTTAF